MSSPSTLLSASELPQALLMLLLALAVLALLDYAKDVGLLARRRSLSGRLVVVTGAAGGLGRALALELARRGALLALWDVRADALHACINWLVDECGVPAERVSASVVDVADAAAVRAAAQSQLDKLGPAHAVVSNAAVGVPGVPSMRRHEEPPQPPVVAAATASLATAYSLFGSAPSSSAPFPNSSSMLDASELQSSINSSLEAMLTADEP